MFTKLERQLIVTVFLITLALGVGAWGIYTGLSLAILSFSITSWVVSMFIFVAALWQRNWSERIIVKDD